MSKNNKFFNGYLFLYFRYFWNAGVLEVIFSHIKSNAQIQGKGLNCMRRCAISCLKVAVNELKATLFNPKEENEQFLAEQIKNVLNCNCTYRRRLYIYNNSNKY